MALDGWRAHLPGLLADSKGNRVATKAAILVVQGEHIWVVSSDGYNLSTDEQKAIVAGLSNPDHVQATGIRADGKKFLTIRAEPERIYGKKQADGIIIVKTVQTVIVVEYAAPVQAAEATVHVERYAQDHLISKGY
ncbi:hypothetical protein AGABI1DRAFT_115039 [Agaricus bisporus var. burnettii JB137-S8]|uniref:Profilin n=1 Tax=Agaricus bisporus var. burnettii (strain JB137-S8 / ATCC MYA-4627 / FGSC 10392) TaxID=597362 RepID=K5WQY9_AGABU|nr:uncharacterized protein AGABI1DRAFT_115039 [Agaricus bisporus var. burnettii JB137-S8]EKM77776.1 hypothetical protein AGABI1DRAFT_115039 [Agaricus bisporus var. burnettii JB137-S8]